MNREALDILGREYLLQNIRVNCICAFDSFVSASENSSASPFFNVRYNISWALA